jgi:hypothetical protein
MLISVFTKHLVFIEKRSVCNRNKEKLTVLQYVAQQGMLNVCKIIYHPDGMIECDATDSASGWPTRDCSVIEIDCSSRKQ